MPENEEIDSVAIKMPTFLNTSASAWFEILEAQFEIKKITDKRTRYFHTVAFLPTEVILSVTSSVKALQDYEILKSDIISQNERSKPELFNQLTETTQLTGKPSALLRDISRIGSKIGIDNDLIRHKFCQSLNPGMAAVVAAAKTTPLDELGRLADELQTLQVSSNVLNVDRRTSSFGKHNPRRRDRSISRSVSDSPSRNRRPKICFAHIYFAEKAKRCKPWCKWPKKNQDSEN